MKASLPAGWEVKKLEEVAEVKLGRQRSPKNHSGPNMHPYLRAANITWKGLSLHDVKEMNFEDADLDTFRLEPGDVLVAEASGSRSEVGKAAIWRGEIKDCCFQNTLIRVRSKGPRSEFLRLVLWHAAASGWLGNAARGVGLHHLGAKTLADWPIVLPPKAEQLAIVQKIEKQITRLEAASTSLEQARTRLSRYKKTVLHSLLSLDAPMAKLGNVASTSSGGTPSRSKPEFYGGDIPWLKSGELEDVVIRSTEEFITPLGLESSSAKVFPAGTLCIAMYGATIGRLGILDIDAATNQAVCGIVPGPSLDRDFLFYVLMALRDRFVGSGKGGAQNNIGQGIIRQTQIPLPAVAQQQSAVQRVQRRLSIVEATILETEMGLRRLESLRRSIFIHALSGSFLREEAA